MLTLLGIEKYLIRVINQHYKFGEMFIHLPFLVLQSMNYAVGHCFSLRDLFMNFQIDKLSLSSKECKNIYSNQDKRNLAASIFGKSVQLVINDIIENNTHFQLPTLGRTQSFLYMDRTNGKAFKKAFKNGKWNDIDFINSNFNGYQIVLSIQSQKRLPRKKNIYLSPKDKQRITDYTNNGKQY